MNGTYSKLMVNFLVRKIMFCPEVGIIFFPQLVCPRIVSLIGHLGKAHSRREGI